MPTLSPLFSFWMCQRVGGMKLSDKPFPSENAKEGKSEHRGRPNQSALFVRALQNGQAEIEVDALSWNGVDTDLKAVFSTSIKVVTAYQYGFMLANVADHERL